MLVDRDDFPIYMSCKNHCKWVLQSLHDNTNYNLSRIHIPNFGQSSDIKYRLDYLSGPTNDIIYVTAIIVCTRKWYLLILFAHDVWQFSIVIFALLVYYLHSSVRSILYCFFNWMLILVFIIHGLLYNIRWHNVTDEWIKKIIESSVYYNANNILIKLEWQC